MISSPIPAAINHLLVQESWAQTRLAAHAGKVAVFDGGVAIVRLQVAPDGLVQSAAEDAPANVTIRIKPADLPLIAQNRDRAFSYVKIEGDADFANTISQLSQSLQWDAEDDLSKWVGDIAATRIVAGARATLHAAQSTSRKLAENAAEYFLEEKPMLIRPQAVADFAGDVARLRDDAERLAKRIDRLKGNAA
ncbi:MAG: SCP2 sterol-binding domain-containing protein [Pseudomonadota bacterium]